MSRFLCYEEIEECENCDGAIFHSGGGWLHLTDSGRGEPLGVEGCTGFPCSIVEADDAQ